MLDNNEHRFNSALIKFFHYFNLLETNIGLCISFLLEPSDPKASYSRLANMTVEQMMMKLKDLFQHQVTVKDESSIVAFNEWYEIASKVRYIRNRYVHGNWEYLPNRLEKPVGFRAPPWMRDRLGDDASEIMSIKKIESIADEMKRIFEMFIDIRKKHNI